MTGIFSNRTITFVGECVLKILLGFFEIPVYAVGYKTNNCEKLVATSQPSNQEEAP